ncbi:MAG: isoleucyl-tRNA synthetase, partial [Pseudonocardiales bacterium]|nr:isoleucyl-tRNA synthetase [Pseudonocardiales bacterium]
KANADTVALDLELTPALRRLGIVRDVVRQIQDTRKSSGLEVTDRIELWWRTGGSPETGEALREHQAALGEEVLAVAIHDLGAESAGSGHDPEGADGAYVDDELGLALWIKRV